LHKPTMAGFNPLVRVPLVSDLKAAVSEVLETTHTGVKAGTIPLEAALDINLRLIESLGVR